MFDLVVTLIVLSSFASELQLEFYYDIRFSPQ